MADLYLKYRQPVTNPVATTSPVSFARIVISALVLALVVSSGAAHADARQDAWQAISVVIARSDAAIMRGDVSGSLGGLTTDFVTISSRGKVSTRYQVYVDQVQLLAMARNIRATSTPQTFDLLSNTEAVEVKTDRVAFVLVGTDGLSRGSVETISTTRAYWVWTAVGWRERRSRVLTFQMYHNGTRIR